MLDDRSDQSVEVAIHVATKAPGVNRKLPEHDAEAFLDDDHSKAFRLRNAGFLRLKFINEPLTTT